MTIYLVDDDADVRESLSWMLEAKGLTALAYESAETFVANADLHSPGVAVLDINMPGMDGLELQQLLIERRSVLALIFLTGYATVPKAVQALQRGALDFIEKPVDGDQLLTLLENGMAQSEQHYQDSHEGKQTELRLSSLTDRERQLLQLVVAGKTNKAISEELFIALRTVEIHRKNLFAKMEVNNAAELALMIGRHQRQ